VARVAQAKRELLLRVHAHRLRREDLEDCYSQAVLELLAYVKRGGAYVNRRHLANAIEQRFVSRIHDRRRALSGRSPMQAALEGAAQLDDVVGDGGGLANHTDVEQLVILREELDLLTRLTYKLTPEQQLVLASQVSLQMECGEFCRTYGWSAEKYRKVAQRARARLKHLLAIAEGGVPSSTLASEQAVGTVL
jgi:DNA-directed RNA polymerase specialized sigma24 family protein